MDDNIMKVLIVSPCILPIPAVKGGAVLTLIESLVAQNEIKKNMDLTVVGSYYEEAVKKSKDYPDTRFIFLKQSSAIRNTDKLIDSMLGKVKKDGKIHQYLWKMHIVSEVKKILKKNDYDRVIFQNSGYLLNVLKDKSITEKYKGKLYYHLHNDIPGNVYIEGVKQCELQLISRYLAKKVNKLCGCDMSNQIHIVKNGFKTQLFADKQSEAEKSELKKSLGIDNDKKVIVFAGRITPYKGIKELLEAFKRLDTKNTVLMIIGSHNFGSGQTSPFEQQIVRSMDEMGDSVVFTGYIPYAQMWKYYQLADVAVLPSMWEEPAGLTMIEAAAAGVPVVTTISGGIPEYLNDELAIFVKRDDDIVSSIEKAINKVFDNPDKWNRIAQSASEYVQNNFSEEKFYEDFVGSLNRGE